MNEFPHQHMIKAGERRAATVSYTRTTITSRGLVSLIIHQNLQ